MCTSPISTPRPQEDQTPLHIASRLGKTDIVQLLLQHMAHPDAATTNGYTPLHISAREGQVETAAVLLEAGASHSLATKVQTPAGLRRNEVAFSKMHFLSRYSLTVIQLDEPVFMFFPPAERIHSIACSSQIWKHRCSTTPPSAQSCPR